MGLPQAVQRQLDEADRLMAQMNGDETGDPPETGDQNPEPNDPPPQEQPVSQEAPVVPAKPADDVWEKKYLTLKGMYDAEVPRLHSQVKELNAQVQQLIAETATAKAVPQADPQKQLITESDKEAFGTDLIDLIERATEQKISTFRAREEQLVEEIKSLKGQLGTVSERQGVSDMERFKMGLTSRVPDWEALNVDQGFIDWLAETDPVYGIPRQYGLNNAYEAFDVNRVATIFEAYKKLLTPVQPKQQKTNELARQVAPTRSRSGQPPADNSTRAWSQANITQFYEDWRRGFISDEEAAKLEQEIHAAIAEGRVS